jgi:hypothetical protein
MQAKRPLRLGGFLFSNEIKHLLATMNETHTRGIAAAWSATASPEALQHWRRQPRADWAGHRTTTT